MKPENKRKKKGRGILAAVILIVLCGGLGFLMGTLSEPGAREDASLGYYILQPVLMVAALYLQIILHEGGHLIAGLLTGYRFSSFRIGSLMLLKTREGYSFKKFSLAGTGGQCLLIPPEKGPDGTYPYKLYHLGGVLMNLLTALLFLVLFGLVPAGSIGGRFLLYLAIAGLICLASNAIPMRVSGIATDGYNVLHIGETPFALEAMWLQLKINEAQTEGIRLKDLSEELFVIPEGTVKNNEIISAIAVFAENRAMDALDFGRAREKIAALEEDGEYAVIGLYKNLLLFDKVTLDLLDRGAEADVSGLNTRQGKAFRKSMARYPAVIRTEYAVKLLKERDPAGAQRIREQFDAVARTYPMKSDIESETEIMNVIASRAGRQA